MHSSKGNERHPSSTSWVLVAICWTLVGVPLAWGVWTTLEKAAVLFY
ncbi:MAG: MFS transporter small subunit [Chromatiales bacterium]